MFNEEIPIASLYIFLYQLVKYNLFNTKLLRKKYFSFLTFKYETSENVYPINPVYFHK